MNLPKKQLLILEDLGISKAYFAQLAEQYDLPYTLLWKEEEAQPEAVEVLINVKKTVDDKLLRKYPKLKAVAVAFTGFDSVDLAYCRQHDIAVYNVPNYATYSVTELVIGLSLALLRRIPAMQELTRSGKWNTVPGLELAGKTIGILGTGQTGLNTARVFSALHCHLLGWSRTEKETFKELGGKYVSDKREIFAQADIVSVHLPLNKSTEGLIGKNDLSAMKTSSFLINTARGAIIDEKALLDVLETQQIAGAGLDVFAREPLPEKHPLRSIKNVILTPHIAFKTEEALRLRAAVTAKNIADHRQGISTNRVN